MMLDLRAIARVLEGEVVSGGVNFRAPGHKPGDRSGRLLLGSQYPEGFWATSWSGDDALVLRDYVRERLGMAKVPQVGTSIAIKAQPAPLDETDRTARALILWQEARDPRGTPVEAYLARRGLELPPEAAGEVIRWHPSCPFAGQRTPAMICLVRDIVTNEPKAVHRTALDGSGHKVKIGEDSRLSFGPCGGGAIKLTPDEDVTTCLGVGEGIETTLSLCLAPEFGRSPIWSLISKGGIAPLPVLSGIECLWIAVDHDETRAGQAAAETCAERWRAAGREVFLVIPNVRGADLNDLARRSRHA